MSLISTTMFFLIREEGLVLWDYAQHKQFIITPDYFSRLLALSDKQTGTLDFTNPIDQQLIDNDILNPDGFAENIWGWDELSKIYHFGTSDIDYDVSPENTHEWAAAYKHVCENTLLKPLPGLRHEQDPVAPALRLMHPSTAPNETLATTLQRRKTVREFTSEALTREQLEHILFYTLGYLPKREQGVNAYCPEGLRNRRASPSGGGLNSVEGYVYINDVAGIERGTYYYDPANHSLIPASRGDLNLGHALTGQHFADDLPFGIFLVCQFDRLWWKYEHSRAYRVALLDVGHLSQTFQLVATSLGLSTWVSAALNEKYFKQMVDTDQPEVYPLMFVGAGHSLGSDIPRELAHALDQERAHE